LDIILKASNESYIAMTKIVKIVFNAAEGVPGYLPIEGSRAIRCPKFDLNRNNLQTCSTTEKLIFDAALLRAEIIHQMKLRFLAGQYQPI
jgi:hypothetical protein